MNDLENRIRELEESEAKLKETIKAFQKVCPDKMDLIEQNNKLAATVEQLRDFMESTCKPALYLAKMDYPLSHTASSAVTDFKSIMNSTESTNLNSVKREAILEAVEQNCPLPNGDESDLIDRANGYNEALVSISKYAVEKYG